VRKAKVVKKVFPAKHKPDVVGLTMTAHDIKKKFEKKANLYLEKIAGALSMIAKSTTPGFDAKALKTVSAKKGYLATIDKLVNKKERMYPRVKPGIKLEKKAEEIMENKYLNKVANDHKLRGYISPAWQENSIAKDHGREGLKGVGANVGKHITGHIRVLGRGVAESLGGAGVGVGAGALIAKLTKKNPQLGALIGANLGYVTGGVHGVVKSLKNQAAEAHLKYSQGQEKKAEEIKLAGAIMSGLKALGKGVVSDAGKVGNQVKGLATAVKAGTDGAGRNYVGQAVKDLAKNKAVQVGAGATALAGTAALSSSGQNKQASELEKLAGKPVALVTAKQIANSLVNKMGKTVDKPGAYARAIALDRKTTAKIKQLGSNKFETVRHFIRKADPKIIDKIKKLDL
jgi:hypothetical protein